LFVENGTAGKALGSYRAFARLGRGGMADVYLAIADGPPGADEFAVIKRLREEDDPLVRMFVDEARLTAQIDHPNVVRTYGAGASSAGHYIAMEFLDGQPLSALLARARKVSYELPVALGLHVVCEALSGLHYVHALRDRDGRPLDVVHRDVSPHNLFLTYAGEVKVVDFGVAKAASNRTVTANGSVKGKARYMSPEQVNGEADRRSDVFAAGIVLWEFVTGEKLFEGDELQVLSALLRDPIPRAGSARPGLDPALDAVIARALERDVERRYQTAGEMRDALLALLPLDQAAAGGLLCKVLDELFAGVREESRRSMRACLLRARSTSRPGEAGAPLRSAADYDALPDLMQRTSEAPVRASWRPFAGGVAPPVAAPFRPGMAPAHVAAASTHHAGAPAHFAAAPFSPHAAPLPPDAAPVRRGGFGAGWALVGVVVVLLVGAAIAAGAVVWASRNAARDRAGEASPGPPAAKPGAAKPGAAKPAETAPARGD
jgi:protein kinase-like protein